MKELVMFLLLGLLMLPAVLAQTAELDTDISSEDKAQFDEILTPVQKIYNFVKYISTVVAALYFVYAGIVYITSSNSPQKREQAKTTAGYVVIGLIVIWAAPFVISLLV